MGKKPAIRFEGYTEDWEQRQFGEIVSRSSEMSDTCALPRVEYEDIVSGIGQLNKDIRKKESRKIGLLFCEGDVLYGKLRPYLQNWLLPLFSGIAVGDFWVLQPQNADSGFVYRLIQTKQFDEVANQSTGTKMPRADWKLVSKTEFSIPQSIDEQAQIGTFFRHLDHLITLHQSNYEKMVVTKKSMLDKLFPQDNAKVPAIRFEGFVGDWEKKPLEAIVIPYSDPVEVPQDGYGRLGIRSHGKGVFHEYVEAGKEITTAQLHRVAAHNFIVNITFAWEHAVAVTCDSDAGKLVSHRFPQFSMAEGIHDQFLKYMILDARFRHHLLLSSPGGAGRNRVLKIPEMLEYEMMIPDIDEQKQIAGYLNSLDDLIELYRIRVEKLKNIKAACLQGMFV